MNLPYSRRSTRDAPSVDGDELLHVLTSLERVAATRRARTTVIEGARHSGRLLGNLLVVRGYLFSDQLQSALDEQLATTDRLGEIVVRRGWISEGELVELLAEQLRLPVVDLDTVAIDRIVARCLSADDSRELCVLPIRRSYGSIDVAVADATDDAMLEFVRRELDAPIRLFLARRTQIVATIAELSRCEPFVIHGAQRSDIEARSAQRIISELPAQTRGRRVLRRRAEFTDGSSDRHARSYALAP